MIIAPASANIIAKLSAGLCDDVVSLTACALPNDTPLLLAPAMNADMWDSPIVQKNVATLEALESITLTALRQWRFNPIQSNAPQREVEGVITFRYILK